MTRTARPPTSMPERDLVAPSCSLSIFLRSRRISSAHLQRGGGTGRHARERVGWASAAVDLATGACGAAVSGGVRRAEGGGGGDDPGGAYLTLTIAKHTITTASSHVPSLASCSSPVRDRPIAPNPRASGQRCRSSDGCQTAKEKANLEGGDSISMAGPRVASLGWIRIRGEPRSSEPTKWSAGGGAAAGRAGVAGGRPLSDPIASEAPRRPASSFRSE